MTKRIAVSLAVCGAALGACGFSEDGACIPPPCPVPYAIEVRVTAEDAGPVTGVVVRVAGGGTNSCQAEAIFAVCRVIGYSGDYDVEIAGVGFEPAQRHVTVPGAPAPRPCSCPSVTTVQLDVTLRRAP